MKVIRMTLENFNTQPDKDAIERINDSLLGLQQSRDLRAREAESALRSTTLPGPSRKQTLALTFTELNRNLSAVQQQQQELLAANGAADHASHIVELDTRKFRMAKSASDLEAEGERIEQELEGLRGRLYELDVQGVEGSDPVRAQREIDDPTM